MNRDLIVQPLDEVRAVVDTLAAGLGRGVVFTPEQWDRSVTELARCHDQVGGDTRRLLYVVFQSCLGPGYEIGVADHLEALRRHLHSSEPDGASVPRTDRV
jgi:hypothetical protein